MSKSDSRDKQKRPRGRPKREYHVNPVVPDPGIRCPHCGWCWDHAKIKPFVGYPNGAHRYKCGGQEKSKGGCKRNFVAFRRFDAP